MEKPLFLGNCQETLLRTLQQFLISFPLPKKKIFSYDTGSRKVISPSCSDPCHNISNPLPCFLRHWVITLCHLFIYFVLWWNKQILVCEGKAKRVFNDNKSFASPGWYFCLQKWDFFGLIMFVLLNIEIKWNIYLIAFVVVLFIN